MELNRDDDLGGDSPRVDRWLAVMLLAIVPMLAALALRELVMHLATISGILFASGGAMFIAQERRRR
jgi:hypothetical protein